MIEYTWEVKPDDGIWKVFREGVRVLHKPDRETCVAYARREAANEREFFDHAAKLIIYEADGTSNTELFPAKPGVTA